MTTARTAETRCDAPGCGSVNGTSDDAVRRGWARLELDGGAVDACSHPCLVALVEKLRGCMNREPVGGAIIGAR